MTIRSFRRDETWNERFDCDNSRISSQLSLTNTR